MKNGTKIYLVLVKMDFYFFVGFIIQYNLIDVHFDDPESSLTWALIPAALIVMLLSIHAARRERILFMIPIIVSLLQPELIKYRPGRITNLQSTPRSDLLRRPHRLPYQPHRHSEWAHDPRKHDRQGPDAALRHCGLNFDHCRPCHLCHLHAEFQPGFKGDQ